GRAGVLVLGRNAGLGFKTQAMAVIGATKVRDQNNPLQLVGVHEKIELFGRGAAQLAGAVAARQPGGAARDGPAIVAGDQEMLVAELVKRLAPAPVAAVKRQGPDAVALPTLCASVREHR